MWDSPDLDFSAAACHAEGCERPVTTYWRSCYADLALCSRHHKIINMTEDGEIDFSCCWYPFAANWQPVS